MTYQQARHKIETEGGAKADILAQIDAIPRTGMPPQIIAGLEAQVIELAGHDIPADTEHVTMPPETGETPNA